MERETTRERRKDSAGGADGDSSGGGGREGVSLKVAVPVFEARLIKTPVQYLWWRDEGKRGGGGGKGGGRKVGQGASLIRSRKASQIDLSKTMARLLRNINPHSFNIGQLCHRFL